MQKFYSTLSEGPTGRDTGRGHTYKDCVLHYQEDLQEDVQEEGTHTEIVFYIIKGSIGRGTGRGHTYRGCVLHYQGDSHEDVQEEGIHTEIVFYIIWGTHRKRHRKRAHI